MLPTLCTERLLLRPVTHDDLGTLVALNSDPEVMRFLLGRAATPVETAEEWDRRLTRQSDPSRGLGYWLGLEGDDVAGWWSASSFEGRPELSGIGYRLRRSSWGRGLASEGARAMVRQAFSDPAVQRVLASTMGVNVGSRRVLEKIGLAHTSTWTYDGRDGIPGHEHGDVGYELTRAGWSAAQAGDSTAS